MRSSQAPEKALLAWCAALPIAAICAVFVASTIKDDLLGWVIDTRAFLPIFGAAILVRGVAVVIAFFSLPRPPETRTVRALLWRDEWLSEKLSVSQPRLLIALGSSLVFMKLAMLAAIIVAAVCVLAHIMSLQQAVSMFVVGTMLWIVYQAIVGSILLLRQINAFRMAGHP